MNGHFAWSVDVPTSESGNAPYAPLRLNQTFLIIFWKPFNRPGIYPKDLSSQRLRAANSEGIMAFLSPFFNMSSPMIKLLVPIVHNLILRPYWWLFRPVTRGARAIIVNQIGEVLLVMHTYLNGWFLPGGKNQKNEDDEYAMRRELFEELGIQVVSTPQRLGEYTNTYEYKKDTIVVFIVDEFTQKDTKHFEIEKYGFFNPKMLPEKTSPGTRRRIEEWLDKKPTSSQW